MGFQYTEIDEATLEVLRKQDLHGPLGDKVPLKKWCIDTQHSIALLDAGWVSSMIARMGDDSSFLYFLLIVNGVQTRIELIRQGLSINAEKRPLHQDEIAITTDFAEKCGFTLDQLKRAVCEAIRVLEIGQKLD